MNDWQSPSPGKIIASFEECLEEDPRKYLRVESLFRWLRYSSKCRWIGWGCPSLLTSEDRENTWWEEEDEKTTITRRRTRQTYKRKNLPTCISGSRHSRHWVDVQNLWRFSWPKASRFHHETHQWRHLRLPSKQGINTLEWRMPWISWARHLPRSRIHNDHKAYQSWEAKVNRHTQSKYITNKNTKLSS